MPQPKLTIRPAHRGDVGQIFTFIRALADYEKLSHEVIATEEMLDEALFGDNPVAHVILGEINGVASGFALYFYNFSTFVGRSGLYLEDLFVTKESRGHGLGKALILYLAAKAHDEGCGRMDWAVLNWNTPSINFYRSLGAEAQEGWMGYRLNRKALKRLMSEMT